MRAPKREEAKLTDYGRLLLSITDAEWTQLLQCKL